MARYCYRIIEVYPDGRIYYECVSDGTQGVAADMEAYQDMIKADV